MKDAEGRRVARFTRLETFGEADVRWVRVRVDSRSEEVFAIEPQVVAANVPAHLP